MSPSSRTILVVEDRDADRLYLTTLLGYGGFNILEATSGKDGLAAATAQRPDLVISDVLMPNMDGYEFVRRLRRLPNCTDVPVMFYTATYHETEARQLAEECGVFEVLIKPSEPEVILGRVATVLQRDGAALDLMTQAMTDEAFGERHGRLTSETLIDKVRKLEASERRMAALVRLGQQFMAERDPAKLLRRAGDELRDATESSRAMVGVLSTDLKRFTFVTTPSGNAEIEARLLAIPELPAAFSRVTHDRQSLRGRTTNGTLEHLDLGFHLDSFLIVPLMSADQVLGLMAVVNKLGGAEFSTADEQLAVTLGVQAGTAYENALLIERLHAQAAELREREETTEFALNAAGIGVYERSIIDNRIRVSGGVRRLLGVTADYPLHELGSLLQDDERRAGQELVDRATTTGGDFTFDLTIGRDTASPRYLQARGRIQDADGAPQRLLSVLIDMTERRGLEQQLRQAQKMEAIGQLAGGVAHDFNNILTVIQGYSRFLLESAQDEEQRRDAQLITEAGARAVALTRQLLAFSRRQPRDIAVFDLNLLISGIAGMLGRLIGEHISLVTSLGDAGTIENDRGQIEQVVMNLVVNARDAMPAGGTITLETSRVAVDGVEWVRLAVRDTGSGMTEDTKARIFEPFFTTKGDGKGTGLGLATVFGIVAQSQGSIEVDTELGRGTTFTILLPPSGTSVVTPNERAAGSLGGDETVLVVEDSDAVRELICTILTRVGYKVIEVSNATEALAVDLDTIDVLLTDVLMPGGLGPQLVADARARRPDLPAVFMSGYAPDDTLGNMSAEDGTVFLAKPFTVESLTQKIREVLDR